MPTYQYACTSCGEQVEVVQKFTDDPLTVCPVCGGALRKVYSAVGIVFKGSGFYRTDSRAEAKSGSGAAKGSSDSSPDGSSSDGESKPSKTGSKTGSDSGKTGSDSGKPASSSSSKGSQSEAASASSSSS
ncbi:MAG TPA: FmdB family zinc ribbon protein [Actinomycetes bacterium]